VIPQYYQFDCPVKILSGHKALSNLPYEADLMGLKKAMVVTDPGVVAAGLLKHLKSAIEGTKFKLGAIYDKTPPDSSNHVANEVAEIYRKNKCDCLLAIGGGSCIDTAKAANIVISEETDDLMKFQGADNLTKPTKPMIVIPTTAGTGSEVTLAAVIRNVDTDRKMPFMSDRLYPRLAIIDPVMTMTMPPKVTAATGMDALTHAIEAYYGLQKNPISDALALSAIDLTFQYLAACTEKGSDKEARLAMANAALIAGIAFSNSMVGIVHALAHSCGGVAHVPHGVANAILLPFGMEYNLKKAPERIATMAQYMGIKDLPDKVNERAKAAIQAVRDLNKKLNKLSGIPLTLADAGVAEDQLSEIAKASVNDGSCLYNPEDITVKSALAVLKKAYK
jgi:alcohol dehydrogenase